MTSPPILYIVAVEHHGIITYHASTEPIENSVKYLREADANMSTTEDKSRSTND